MISERWQAFLEEGEQEGTLQLVGPDGTARDVEYTAKGNVLPVRHLLVLRDKTKAEAGKDRNPLPSWVQDYALFLLDVDGQIVAWYAGAERIYGYKSDEALGQHVSVLYPDEDAFGKLQEQLKRAAGEGHVGAEGWHVKKDGSRFWANVITMALKDENGDLQGFARVVRDFSDRHERDEKLRRSRGRVRGRSRRNRPLPASFPESLTAFPRRTTRFSNWSATAVRICSPAGCCWPDLTPPEYRGLGRIGTRRRIALRSLHAL